MVETILKRLLDNSANKEILNHKMYKLHHYALSASKRFTKEELKAMEDSNYSSEENVFTDLTKIAYEIKSISEFLKINSNFDFELIRLVKTILNEIEILVANDDLESAKQLITIIQICLGLIPSFYLSLLELDQSLKNIKLTKKKQGESYE